MSANATFSCFGGCFTHQFRLNYVETELADIGESVSSGNIFAGGHLWRILCYPGGDSEHISEYLSIFLLHKSTGEDVFEAVLMHKDSTPSPHLARFTTSYQPKGTAGDTYGFPRFMKRSDLNSFYPTAGNSIVIKCGVTVVLVHEDPLVVPPPNIGGHLGVLLDSAEGSDVSFVVDGETFPAHRAVLTARSPVFKAQLLGSMADAQMPSITLHDIAPATFRVMLRFMYTDACPTDAEIGDSPVEMFELLLVAADRFALDRLKLLCARKLWDNVSVHTVAHTSICAETYNCPGLKKKSP